MTQTITRLTSLTIPPELGLRRDPPPRAKVTSEAFWDLYDSTTLFYTAIYDAVVRQLHVFAPPMLNFSLVVKRAQFYLNGQKLDAPHVIHAEKFDQLIFVNIPSGSILTMAVDGTESAMPVLSCDSARFAGRRVVYTMSRNNDLAWIKDWMIWNQQMHKADAVLIVDNGTTAYEADELAATLRSVAGYNRAEVMQVPSRYGPDITTAHRAQDGAFLQTALMNAFWMLWLRYARAVLNVDVDELIVSASGEAIFDAVESATFGLVMATGHWRYAAPGSPVVRHRDHTLMLPGDTACPPKYCLRPDGLAARQTLKVHGVKNFKRVPFVNREHFTFLHCRNISTSWKYDRSKCDYGAMVEDSETKTLLKQVYSETIRE